jgi:phosphatidylglycerol---prolipoprotein diacylglyceryl transferase
VLAVHPTQLYEIFLALIMFAVLWRLSGRLRVGRLFAVYLAMYGVLRFGVEFVRAKTDLVLFGLSTSQYASLILLVLAVALWMRSAHRPDAGSAGGAGSAGATPDRAVSRR